MSRRPFGSRAATLIAAALVLSACGSLPSRRPTRLADPFAAGAAGPPANAAPLIDLAQLADHERLIVELYEGLNSAVVHITTIALSPGLFTAPVPRETGFGSGAIIDPRGYIITNFHVIEGAAAALVTLADRSVHQATLIGVDPENDLAVLKIDPGEAVLHTAPLGSSASLRVGQAVLAIGNPFGLDRTLTTGVISGVNRPLETGRGFLMASAIQTDAAINPGNSGGPLFDLRGNMIGENTAIFSPSGASAGIGFAVPSDTVKRVVPQIIAEGRVIRGWLDIRPIQITPGLARRANLPIDYGVLVLQVASGSTAAQGGLRGGSNDRVLRSASGPIRLGGDIIIAMDQRPVPTLAAYLLALETSKPGNRMAISVIRDGRELQLHVTLAARPVRP